MDAMQQIRARWQLACIGVLAAAGCEARPNRSERSRTPEEGAPPELGTAQLVSSSAPIDAPEPSGSGCPAPALGEDVIDDMEHRDGAVPELRGRSGFWFTFHDETPGATLIPASGSPFQMTNSEDRCRHMAARVVGDSFTTWGAGMGVGLGQPYDAAAYEGVSFWAKGQLDTTNLLRVSFPNKDTDPKGQACADRTDGTERCHDHFGAQFRLSPSWRKVTLHFAHLRQRGWGHRAPEFDRQTLYGIHFELPIGTKFELWVDELAFTEESP
jgi:hypothetical protein